MSKNQAIRVAIEQAVKSAITEMGSQSFKRTSFFGRNWIASEVQKAA